LKTAVVCLFLAASYLPVPAQTVRGAISGAVTDDKGKPLSNVALTLKDLDTNKLRTVTTGPEGFFLVSSLSPGNYRLTAAHAGYRTHSQDLVLQVNQEIRLDVPLLPGSRTEQVTVTAVRSLLKTENAALGGVIETRQITGLPLDGRNFTELALLAPGVSPAAPGSAGSVRGDFAINVNGAREDSNSFLLDGVLNIDPKLNAQAVNPPVDAVREFEVLTGNYDASFARNAGGQINAVLRSGTNRFHGAAYEFFRNGAMDARNFFAPGGEPKPQYQRNQFGGALGGPVRRDRTFFFADYEGRRIREGITRVTNVPTARERIGDFSESPVPVIDPFTQMPFPGNRIPREYLHPVGAVIAALYPLPNRNVPGQNFVSSPSLRDRNDQFDVRIDHALSRSSDLSFRYSFADRSLFDPFSGPQFAAVPGYGVDVPRRAQNAMASHTQVFTPLLLNELRAGFNRVSAGSLQQNRENDLNRAAGLPRLSAAPRTTGLSYITITGYSPLGDEYNNPQHSTSNIYQLTDQATWIRGRHHVRFGGDLRLTQQNAFRDVQSRGFLSFLGLTGNALAETLLGFPSTTGGALLDNHQHLRTRSYNLFAQDSWRLRDDLTVSAGVRYEYNTPGVDAEDRANLFDPATRSLVQAGANGLPRSGYDPDRNNFGPRVGLAWRPGQRGTVIRTGYGIYYDQAALAPGEGLYFNAPYFDFRFYFTLDPRAPLTLSDPFPRNFAFPTPPSALGFQRDLRTPYYQQWNFTIQQQLGQTRVFEIAYAGSKGTKLLAARDINQPAPTPAQRYFRPLPQFEDITLVESRGSSIYHSLQMRFQQHFARGMTALASYTWSKSIDDTSSFFSSAGDPNFPQDSFNLRAERGRSNFDTPHRFVMSYSYDLPFGKGLLGGWQTYGIWTFQSGRPFTVALLSDFDNSNTGRSMLGFGANDRPHLLRNPELEDPGPDRWFDTTAFAIPPRGEFGNSGRNILDGPCFQSINVSIVKDTRLTESFTAQFRAEAFNLLNSPSFGLPDVFVGSPSFGRILSAHSPRHIQLGLKFLF
jgi:hypothetical protein